jgi:hypothetical protein
MTTKTRFLWMFLMAWPMFVASQEPCSVAARTAMEKAYCEVEKAGFAAALPPLHEFRKNPEKTQRLLLRRPAQRAGVTLPTEQKPSPSAKPKLTRLPTPAAAPPAKSSVEQSFIPADIRSVIPTDVAQLPCSFQGEEIVCGQQRYLLLGNQANNRLAPDALTSARSLTMAAFRGSPANSADVMKYLDESYPRYIDAMVAIGLGASTMSFTKFYHTFIEVQRSGADFAARMATMFEFLKKDKKSMAVQAHFSRERPTNISQCRRLSGTLLVCDDVKHNWLYQRRG